MKYLGIDLGTANTSIYLKNQGIVCREPTVVTLDLRTNDIIAVGNESRQMIGKTPETFKIIKPIKDGVIAEFDATAEMLNRYFRQIAGASIFSRPKVVVCVPNGITEVERRALQDVVLEAGAQAVALVEETLAAASGSGIKIENAKGGMIVDIGAGTTESAIISFGSVVLSSTTRTAGDELDEAIITYIRRRYNVLIGEITAETLKKRICTMYQGNDDLSCEVIGRNLSNGLPAVLNITSLEVREAISDPLNDIINNIKQTLEAAPPELASDILDFGIILTGGCALIKGLDALIQQITGIKTTVAQKPLDAVALGVGKMMEIPNLSNLIQFKNR